MKKLATLIFVLSLFLSIGTPIAQAQGGSPLDLNQQEGFSGGEIAGSFGQNPNQPTDIRTIIVKIIKVVLTLLGIIFFGLMIYSGWLWMTAAGNDEQVSKAKTLIIQAVIGLLIIFSSYSLTAFILNRVDRASQNRNFTW
jgi:hypothetical protein